jgi:hypothetical protein
LWLESGERGAADVDVAALLTVYGLTGAEFARLIGLCRHPDRGLWLQPFGDDREVLTEEARATSIVGYDPTAIPSLLQTADTWGENGPQDVRTCCGGPSARSTSRNRRCPRPWAGQR